MNITLTISGNAAAKVRALGSRFYNFQSAFERIGEDSIEYYTDAPFASGGQIYGNRWPALKEATQTQKANSGYRGMPMLVRTGQMKEDFHFEAGPQQIRIYNGTDYFQYHQKGTSRMPQRLIMAFNQNRKDAIKKRLIDDINEKLAL